MLYRDRRLFARALLSALLMGGLILTICAGIVLAIVAGESRSTKLLRVAISNEDTTSPLGEMAIRMVSSHELVSTLVTIELCDTPQEAIDAVQAGASGAVILPDGFFESIMTGEDLPCQLVLNESNTFGGNTIAAYADVGSDALSAAQYAVYSGITYLRAQGVSEEAIGDYVYALDMKSFSHVSEAQKRYFRSEEIPYTAGGLSMMSHYLVLYTAFFFSMLILSFSQFYTRDSRRDTLIRLRASGVSSAAFLRWKLILPGILFSLLSLVVLGIGSQLLPMTLTPANIFFGILASFFCAIFGGLLMFGLGSFGGCTQFLVTALGLFLCGGILPYSRMNPLAAELGNFTPLGVLYRLFAPLCGGKLTPVIFPVAAVYLLLGILLARHRLQQLVKGRDAL